jgi:hypothetical protein
MPESIGLGRRCFVVARIRRDMGLGKKKHVLQSG